MLEIMSPKTVRLTVSEILEKRGISTREFAQMAGLTYNQALAMKRGVYTRIDFPVMLRICNALGVQPGDLFAIENSET